ncbi:MAG: HD domain-containing protein [Synergistaceae bacterium]|nr:HD domain-containing protein [Synergistaceae bacterium]
MREEDFSGEIKRAGGRAYTAGGWVRDVIRGVVPHDKDYVVTGVSVEKFESLFPAARRAGRRFPVYRLRIGEVGCDVAFARREIKSGTGYKGFDVSFGEATTIRDDLERRDTTINSMAMPLEAGELIDPFGGARDIERRVIRAASEHFKDDPVRALRAARQASQFGYSIEPRTMKMMGECREELAREPGGRITRELSLALEAERPSVFFRNLLEANLLDVTYPQLHALVGAEQDPRYHPEGDAFAHTMLVLDRASELTRRPEVRFAALAHDIGKGLVPPGERPHYYGHERLGVAALEDWNRLMTLPKLWMACAEFAITHHMRVGDISKPGKIVDFLTRLSRNPIGPDGMAAVVRADAHRLPPFLENAGEYRKAMGEVSGRNIPENLTGPARGEWLRQERIGAVMNLFGK